MKYNRIQCVKLAFIWGTTQLIFLSCGGGSSGTYVPPPGAPAIAISPGSAELGPGSSLQFKVLNATAPVSWTLKSSLSDPGSISSNGLYTAPMLNGEVDILVTDRYGQTVDAPVSVWNHPSANSLVFSPPEIRKGNSSSISINFGFGSGVLTPPGVAVTSGQNYSVSPLVNSIYTLTVTNLQGDVATSSGGVRVRDTGGYQSISSMLSPRTFHTSTLLSSGKVLICGGFNSQSGNGTTLSSAEIFDPSSGRFTPTGSMKSPRSGHSATLLNDGTVLVVGGYTDSFTMTTSAEIYDPVSGAFTLVGSMKTPRAAFTALLLADGRVLVAGGSTTIGNDMTAGMEIYDPATRIFTSAIDMRYPRMQEGLYLRQDGTVLIVGGVNSTINAEVFDPTTNSSTYLSTSINADGIINGGRGIQIPGFKVFTYSCNHNYILNLSDFSSTDYVFPSIAAAPGTPALAYIPTGRILMVGGYQLAEGGTFDVNLGGFNQVGKILLPREYADATTLKDGRVLITGGETWLNFNSTSEAEIFDPTVSN